MKSLLFYRAKDLFFNIGEKWDKLSPSADDVVEFACLYLNPQAPQKISMHEFSPEYVIAHHGEMFNIRLRENRADEDDLSYSTYISSHLSKKDFVAYRGVCKSVLEQMFDNAKDLKGVDLLDKAFLYSSLVKGDESNSAYKLRIYVPKGTEVLYIGNVNEEGYSEIVIQRETPLKIMSVDDTYINCKIIRE